ncbi:MAG: hypothetical protein ACI4VS_01310 [Candidatus Nanosyncoccaceae bacterium]
MFEIELKNPNEMIIKAKDRVVNINVAQCTIEAGLAVGPLVGAGEFEIGEIIINAIALKNNKVMYRIDVDGIKIGLAGEGVQTEELDELGPIDILGATDHKIVGIIEPKILIPMGNMDFAEVKASVNVEKKLKIKNENSLPATLTIYKMD